MDPSCRIASFPLALLLGLAVGLAVVEASPYPRPYAQMMPQVRRLPRRNDFVAYNLHRIIRPRDVNDLGVDQARKAMHDVHETIAEVQRLLALDPSLPRLTRGEIEELFENVTREEFSKSVRAGDHSRAQHMRALMLVLPYHANNMSPENLQQIYTRPPVTRIVGGETSRPSGAGAPLPPARLIATTTPPPLPEVTVRARATTTPSYPVTTIRFTTPRPTTFHPTLPERMGLRQEEVNDILASIGLSQSSSEEGFGLPHFKPMPATTGEPPRTEEVTTTPSPTTTTTSRTTTTPTTTTITAPNNAINVDDPKVAQELKDLLRSFGLLNEDGPSGNSIGLGRLPVVENLADIHPAALVLHEPLRVDESVPTTVEQSSTTTTSTSTTTTTTVAPKPANGLTQASVKADDYVAFKPLSIGGAAGWSGDKPRDEELDELLQSFGLLGPGSRNKKSMLPAEAAATAGGAAAGGVGKPPAPMKSMPAINPDLVAPQLMRVLGTLGIQKAPTAGSSSPEEEVHLPAPVFRRREKTGRKLEPPTTATTTQLGEDQAAHLRVTNEDYRKLEQLWQTVKQLEKLNENLTDDSLDALNPHRYNLSPSLLAQQGPNPLDAVGDVRDRLNEIKKRQQPATDDVTATADSPTRFNLELNANGTASGESERSPVEDGAATSTETGDEGTTSTTTTASTTTTSTTPSAPTTTTRKDDDDDDDGARNAALLHESFPSDDHLAGDPVDEEPLPPPRRTGFYFLYDWNTFLEVGEEPNKVIIRYNPRAGDPSRFLPVTVP